MSFLRKWALQPSLYPLTMCYMEWAWRRAGEKAPPPPAVKHRLIVREQKKRALPILVETGTYTGHTVQMMRPYFSRIISIELNADLYDRAVRRFAGIEGIEIRWGDSAVLLPEIVDKLDAPALFWLDGHWTEAVPENEKTLSPIHQEIAAILQASTLEHSILIDDARLFTGQGEYPELTKTLAYLRACRPAYDVRVCDDIIRASPSHD
jgi:hypothetical protein